MRVILASPRGFCAGVNMAIESLSLAIQTFGPPVYVYHEIVHNKYVVEYFRAKGGIFVDNLDEVPVGAHLLFSAHGVSPEIRHAARQRRLDAIDATCPLVTKVHLEAVRFAKAGFRVTEIPSDEPARIGGIKKMSPLKTGWEILQLIFRDLFFYHPPKKR